MGLRFVLGRSGTGKTEYLRNFVIKNSCDNPDTNYIVMVPEQSNLQTQTAFVTAHPSGGILNIDILSFKRLAYRIFSETGGFHNKVLDESGKLMILKIVAEECKDKLTVLKKPMERLDSLDKLKSLFSEFSQYHVNAATFDEIIKKDTVPGLSPKLKDLITIYDYYLNYISEEFITDEQVMDVLAEKIEVSEFVKNTVFVFDEYTGFTYLQNEVIRKLIRCAKDVIVALTMDISLADKNVVPEYNLFALSVKTKSDLTQMAIEEKIKVYPDVYLNGNKKNAVFDYLEKNLFDYAARPLGAKTDNITICESISAEEEVRYLREKIASLVRDEGYSYKDIAVVTGDLARYGIHFEKLMNEADIPCFVDDSKYLINNPFVESVRALMDVVIEDFSYKSVFRLLKSGLFEFSKNQTDILENYCLGCGIYGYYRWSNNWDKLLKNMDEDELNLLNELRSSFVSSLQEYVFIMKKADATVKERTVALFALMAELKIEGKLLAISERFDASGDYVKAIEYRQVYAAVIHLLDELVELMGDKKISCEAYLEILISGISAVKIGVLPPGNDYVILADVERSRIDKTKVLFLLGANEGIIPKNTERIGFLNESERMAIKESKITLAPTSHEEYYTQKYYLYRILTKATEKLYVSYSNFGEQEEIKPSYLVKCIEDLFPSCVHVNTDKEFKTDYKFQTKADAYDYLLYSDDYKNATWNMLYEYLVSDDSYKNRLTKIQEGLIYKGDMSSLGERIAEEIFFDNQKNYTTSISRLETFASCPFAHFLRYGLKVYDRESSDMNAVDYGNVFHTALEDYVRILKQMQTDVANVSDDVADTLAVECINNAYNKIYRSYNEPSSRDKYHINRMIRLMKRTVWVLRKQFTDSAFTIKNVEYKFDGNNSDYTLKLNNNKKVHLNGKIDRIDTYSDGINEIVRVVDYKTGSTGFSLVKFYYGLQLQLIVYLDIASQIERRNNKNVIPAGAFYYNINDPIIDMDKLKDNDIDGAVLKELKLHGYQNVLVNNSADKNADERKINNMLKHSRNKLKELCEEISSGDVSKNPYMLYDKGLRTGCDYCDYKQLCLFDDTLPWCKVNDLKALSEEEIFTKLQESEDAGDELDR